MTGIVVFFFVAAALFAALGLADQRKLYWRFAARRYRNPEANEPSDSAYAWQRVLIFIAAAVMAFQGFKALDFADDSSWSAGELGQAVEQAASALEEEPRIDDEYSDYSDLIEQEVEDAGEGMGPGYAVNVESADSRDDYEITAEGTDVAYCMSVSQTESDEGGFTVPGAGDQQGTYVPEYDLNATTAEGAC
ncbi:hypothetical protein AB0D71_14760 [Streptomyces avermitilis]|uniref:hypothetical protein n=1 Tax=Streptomyces avermitilis TaxID=33903 RepID=UPI0033C7E6DA